MKILEHQFSELANAIVLQAVVDYQRIERRERNGDLTAAQRVKNEREKVAIVKFLASEVGDLLCHGHGQRIAQALVLGKVNRLAGSHNIFAAHKP